MNRIVSWFSCGAASAVATKIMLGRGLDITIAYCYVKEEHDDNIRFLKECEEWFGQKVIILKNEFYDGSCINVFKKNYFRYPGGAPCTRELKANVRKKFQKKDDTIVFGYTYEEEERFNRFIDRNNSVDVVAPLIEEKLYKSDVLAMTERAGIELPMMYKLGYEHNNCVGCVKGGMGYWNKIRTDFPDIFKKYADLEKELGASILKDKNGKLFLHDLDPNRGRFSEEPNIECGITCENAIKGYSS